MTEPTPIDAPSPPPREPLRAGTLAAWLVIIWCVAMVAVLRGRGVEVEIEPAPPPARDTVQLRLMARYAVGAAAALGEDAPRQQLLAQVRGAAATRADELRIVPVIAELDGAEAALNHLAQIELPEDRPESQRLAQSLRQIYTAGPETLDEPQRVVVTAALGWFGELALTWQRPPDDPQRREVLAPARQTFYAMIGVMIGGPAALALGAVLLVLGIVGWRRGRLQFNFEPPAVGGWLVEAFALFLAWFVLASMMRALVGVPLFWGSLAAIAPLACLWPLVRGMSGAELRAGLGLHGGRGVFREIGAGIVGYLAGLPVVAVGFVITFLLVVVTGIRPTHPAVETFTPEFWQIVMLLALAVVYAPLAEELTFRGALYGGMRRRWGVVISALVTSFIFAAIHPQGWVAVPVLMSIAIMFALLREWRGSLIAPVVAHAINNGAVLVLLILVAG